MDGSIFFKHGAEHSRYLIRQILNILSYAQIPQSLGRIQLRQHFIQTSTCYSQKMCVILVCSPPSPFGDIRRDADYRTTKLIGQRIFLIRRKRPDQGVHLFRQIHRLLPYNQFSVAKHQPTSLQLPTSTNLKKQKNHRCSTSTLNFDYPPKPQQIKTKLTTVRLRLSTSTTPYPLTPKKDNAPHPWGMQPNIPFLCL